MPINTAVRTLALNPHSWSTIILYQPLINILFLFYDYIPGHDMGVAIVVLTIIIRLILFPSYLSTTLNAQRLKELEPQIKRLREEHKEDQKKQAEEIMKVYRQNRVSPLGGCLPLLIQLPILWVLYRIFAFGLNESSLSVLYSWVPKPAIVGQTFLGLVALDQKSIPLAILAGLFQLLQSYLSVKTNALTQGNSTMGKAMNWQLMLLFPVMTFLIAWSLPSAIGLYWAATTLIAALQQWYLLVILRRRRGTTAVQ
jgi:YidC/Oxa1 family membrane protein insertase